MDLCRECLQRFYCVTLCFLSSIFIEMKDGKRMKTEALIKIGNTKTRVVAQGLFGHENSRKGEHQLGHLIHFLVKGSLYDGMIIH